MKPKFFGTEGMTDDDRAYNGSRFAEVRAAIFANPYQPVWTRDGSAPLPVYRVTLSSVLRGILSFGKRYLFQQAIERTVDSHADLRWGADGKGFRRLLHPNGICLTGRWKITEDTEYSGYFRRGSEALAVGRYSTCCTETRRGHTRSLALVGKLFPTTDENHPQALRTASFFPAGHRRRTHRLYQRRRVAQRSRRSCLATRWRRADLAHHRNRFPAR